MNEKLNAASTSVNERFQAIGITIANLEKRCNNIVGASMCPQQVNNKYNSIESRISKLERQSLTNELIVTGVPFEKRRSPDDIIADICEALQLDLRQSDFAAIFCLSTRKHNGQAANESKRTSSPLIILRFNYLWAKNNFLDAYYKKKDLNLKDIGFKTARRIYVNESLTMSNRETFKLALQLKKSGKILRCFTRQGLVYLQESETSNSIRVTNKLDLEIFFIQQDSELAPHNENMDTETTSQNE